MSYYQMTVSEPDGEMVCLFEVSYWEDERGVQNTWVDLYKVFIESVDVTSTFHPVNRRALEQRAYQQMLSEDFEDAMAEAA